MPVPTETSTRKTPAAIGVNTTTATGHLSILQQVPSKLCSKSKIQIVRISCLNPVPETLPERREHLRIPPLVGGPIKRMRESRGEGHRINPLKLRLRPLQET